MNEITDRIKKPIKRNTFGPITLLNFDLTLTQQTSLQRVPHQWIDFTDIAHKNGYCEKNSLDEIRTRLQQRDKSKLVYIGSGNYHYVTYLLLETIHQPFSLVLFDHHSDLFEYGPLISCGSWVTFSLRHLPNLKKVVIIGVNEEDDAFYRSNPLFHEKVKIISEKKLNQTPLHILMNDVREHLKEEKNIYISVDKDVLYPSEAITNWDQGSMSVVQLLYIIEKLLKDHSLLGMDVCGEYIKNYGNEFKESTLDRLKMNEIVNVTLANFLHGLITG